ncbi:hypothetical protein N7540_007173 [Penicillium herquei]|nr:hypothetical protein N7540_007173 [Penicillium herquei]
MSPPAAQWPALSGARSTAPNDTARRVLNINHDWGEKLAQLQQDNAEIRKDLTAIRLTQEAPV